MIRRALATLLLLLPTAVAAQDLGLVEPGKLTWGSQGFGTARLGTLFGMVMLVHQAGSFVGIWLGGWLAHHTGRDSAFWAIDLTLALAAAALVWPWRSFTAGAPAATAFAAKP